MPKLWTVQLKVTPPTIVQEDKVTLEVIPSLQGEFDVQFTLPQQATIDSATWTIGKKSTVKFISPEQTPIRLVLGTDNLPAGQYEIEASVTPQEVDLAVAVDPAGTIYFTESLVAPAGPPIIDKDQLIVSSKPKIEIDAVPVTMRRTQVEWTDDKALSTYIRNSTEMLKFDYYDAFMSVVLCGDDPDKIEIDALGRMRVDVSTERATREGLDERIRSKLRLPFPDADAYRLLKVATEIFLMVNCGVALEELPIDLQAERRRHYQPINRSKLNEAWGNYIAQVQADGSTANALPYLWLVRKKLRDVDVESTPEMDAVTTKCYSILTDKLTRPCFLELIWSYWHEEGMLVQTLNAISRRFQNVRAPGDRDPLAHVEIDPLRPLNNFLWGYIQDEQHRLTVVRRAYEYDHHYGLTLVGKAVSTVRGADSRSRFIEGLHNLLMLCSIFFKEDDDTTVVADGFPILNALREVHLLLSQGAHNQYGDLPWTARQEMLMQEWLLARPEMREFLPSRIMVAYPEPWMDRVESMKTLQGWSDVSVMHFRDLGVYGEQILLGIRFNDWTRVIEPERAANWARYWRPEIQGYIHAYRAATGVDLTERADATMPALLLKQRLGATQKVAR